MPRRVGVVVLGMHRSGTSAVAGMFVRAGFFAGRPDDIFPPNHANPSGHHENLGVMTTDQETLIELGGSMLRPPPREVQLAAADRIRPALRGHIERMVDEAAGRPIVVKDPRICILLPLWAEVLGEYLHPVLVVRDPVAVARSLLRRDGTPLPFGLCAWELHMTSALAYLNGARTTVVPYTAVMADRTLAADAVASAAAHLDADARARVEASEASGELDEVLYHHHPTPSDHRRLLTVRQHELWQWLDARPFGDQTLRVPDEIRPAADVVDTCIRPEEDRTDTIWRTVALQRDVEQSRRELAELRSSVTVARARVAELEAAATATAERVAELTRALATAERAHQLMSSSLSWRITRPLRAVRRRFVTDKAAQ